MKSCVLRKLCRSLRSHSIASSSIRHRTFFIHKVGLWRCPTYSSFVYCYDCLLTSTNMKYRAHTKALSVFVSIYLYRTKQSDSRNFCCLHTLYHGFSKARPSDIVPISPRSSMWFISQSWYYTGCGDPLEMVDGSLPQGGPEECALWSRRGRKCWQKDSDIPDGW